MMMIIMIIIIIIIIIITPWYSPVMSKPAYQNTTSEAFWDIPIYAEHNEVRANRIDATCQPREERSLHN